MVTIHIFHLARKSFDSCKRKFFLKKKFCNVCTWIPIHNTCVLKLVSRKSNQLLKLNWSLQFEGSTSEITLLFFLTASMVIQLQSTCKFSWIILIILFLGQNLVGRNQIAIEEL